MICLPLPVKTKINSRTETPILTHKSVTLSVVTFRGDMPAEAPRIRKVLKIFEPTTFPMAISAFFLRAAIKEVANSGREVPIEIMVNPMIRSEIPAI